MHWKMRKILPVRITWVGDLDMLGAMETERITLGLDRLWDKRISRFWLDVVCEGQKENDGLLYGYIRILFTDQGKI